jgi:hypothetical protein
MRPLVLAICIGCAEAKAPVDPHTTSFDIEVQRYAHPPAMCAATEKAIGSTTSQMLALRPAFSDCYNQLLIDDPLAEGKVVLEVFVGPSGQVCNVRMKSRAGLSNAFAQCAAERIAATQFDSPGLVVMPITFEHEPSAHPVQMDVLGRCASVVSVPTDATITYSADENGKVADLRVDPWHGDQDALGCVAEALGAEALTPSQHFVARVKMYP